MKYSASEIAEQVGGEVVGNGDVKLVGFAQADAARAGDLTFAEDEKFFRLAEQSEASAILATDQFSSDDKTVIRVQNARVAFARVLPLFFPEKQFGPGVHPSAVIAESARVDETAHIGPNCVIGENAVIGRQTVLEANCSVGDQSSLGQAVRFFPNVTIYPQSRIGDRVRIHSASVVGSDGYGYVFDEGHHRKIPQIGGVVIGNDVEIGASVTIDRGALGNTEIGDGTKIDNLVQIGHNVVIGKHCLIVAQTGIGGSTQIGEFSTLAGQVGVIGHITIGPKAVIASKSAVMGSLEGGKQYMGIPAVPDIQAKRQIVAVQKLPDLAKRVRELEQQVAEMEPPPPPRN
ncbi:MAG: UDP-3-O-(3-hydroxymyristoyl)glucosamine N-acyltransferase [Verrucomicrobiota bacterium]|jgi:UDP-3-O-[3-hydroxymyristoyl] glucosamine N-acyltransferase|nr:UDP-3-O-(3-hydroxymyristoyl)glucosamine N-acyltransferase [Verrucomicrobiota bacterium]MDP7048871.1 UDP-3-O-(3-hydroxymyristoyl)glucosamine N-acyltransferase [Verrucomicrobiota bacterium]